MNAPLMLCAGIGLALFYCAIGFSSAFANLAVGWFASDTRDARGIKLLREWLSAEQLASFEKTKSFIVVGSHIGKRYRITYGVAQNVYEIDHDGRPLMGICFVPQGYLVAGDVMLGQKISLETDETTALKVARRFSTRSGPSPDCWVFQ